MPKAQGNLQHVFTQGDHILLAEPENWIPISNMQIPATFIGPIFWVPDFPDPVWWSEVDWTRPTIYISVGSSGSQDIIDLVLQAIPDMSLQILISGLEVLKTQNRRAPIYCSNFIANARALEKSCLFISNGGSLSMVDAIRYGKPTIGIASNFDQWQNIGILCDQQVGTGFLSKGLKPKLLKMAIEQLLDPTPGMQSQLERAQKLFSSGLNRNSFEKALNGS